MPLVQATAEDEAARTEWVAQDADHRVSRHQWRSSLDGIAGMSLSVMAAWWGANDMRAARVVLRSRWAAGALTRCQSTANPVRSGGAARCLDPTKESRVSTPLRLPGISIVPPAHDEAPNIVQAIHGARRATIANAVVDEIVA
jgi:hypothetical protein